MSENVKKHNGTISFWKFACSIMIVIFHIGGRLTTPEKAIFPSGRIAVEFFFIVSGFLMAKKAFSIQKSEEPLGKETFMYIWKKAKYFYTYIILAFILELIVQSMIKPYTTPQIANSIWNLLLIDMTGIRTTYIVGQTWYISVMLLSMMILYPLIRKYKKSFTYLIAPLIVLFIGGWISKKYGGMFHPQDWTGLFYKGFLRGFFEIALGTILYEIVENIKNANFTKVGKIILTILQLGGFGLVFYIASIPEISVQYDYFMILLLAISITLSFSEKCLFSNFANNKVFYFLEKISLPLYLNHITIITVINKKLGYLSFKKQLALILVTSIVFSIIYTILMEKIIKFYEKHKKSIKKIIIIEN